MRIETRYSQNKQLYEKLELIDAYCYCFFKQVMVFSGMIHGDPVFTNVIKTQTGIKFIDMRGKTVDNTIYGDRNYDYAKDLAISNGI